MTKKDVDEISHIAIGCAIEVHKTLGPGLLESVYHKCFLRELELSALRFHDEVFSPLEYKGIYIEAPLRVDVVVEGCLVVELKAIEQLIALHGFQVLTYMKLLKLPKGVLINFNCTNIFSHGQRTYVNEIYRALPEE